MTVRNVVGTVVMKFIGSCTRPFVAGWVRIVPLGIKLRTWSASAVAEMVLTRGALDGRGELRGREVCEVAVGRGLGNHGIHVFLVEVVARGRGRDVDVDPGEPFLILMTISLLSSAETSIQVSPEHSSATACEISEGACRVTGRKMKERAQARNFIPRR